MPSFAIEINIFVLFFSLVAPPPTVDGRREAWVIPFFKTTVQIYNALPGEIDLTIHCKSKDDDLGAHVVCPDDFYIIKFRDNFKGTTRFACDFTWKDVSARFDVYDARRDWKRCKWYCRWVARSGDAPVGHKQERDVPDMFFKWRRRMGYVSRNVEEELTQ